MQTLAFIQTLMKDYKEITKQVAATEHSLKELHICIYVLLQESLTLEILLCFNCIFLPYTYNKRIFRNLLYS